MGLTPLFELFTGPLSFHLANYMQRFGWGCSSGKFNPRLPRQTGVNRTVHTLFQSCTVIKVLYYILHGVSYSKWHTICNIDTLWPPCIDGGSPRAPLLMADLKWWCRLFIYLGADILNYLKLKSVFGIEIWIWIWLKYGIITRSKLHIFYGSSESGSKIGHNHI